jgi:hypothetical protein
MSLSGKVLLNDWAVRNHVPPAVYSTEPNPATGGGYVSTVTIQVPNSETVSCASPSASAAKKAAEQTAADAMIALLEVPHVF